jgi:hypothetical protein
MSSLCHPIATGELPHSAALSVRSSVPCCAAQTPRSCSECMRHTLAVCGHGLVERPTSYWASAAMQPTGLSYCMARLAGRLHAVEPGRVPTFGPVAKELLKVIFIFQIHLNSVQNLEIHICFNIAPKFMKPILLGF